MENTNEIIQKIEEAIKFINGIPNFDEKEYINTSEDTTLKFKRNFSALWKQLSVIEKDEIFNKYFNNESSILLRTLLLVEKGLPEEKEEFEKYINDHVKTDSVKFFKCVWRELSDEDKLRVITEKEDSFLEMVSNISKYDKELCLDAILSAKGKITQKMHNMFIATIEELIQESAKDTEKDKEYYFIKLREYAYKIPPELLTPQNFSDFYNISKAKTWAYIPERKQNDELFNIAISNKEDIYSIWNYTKNQSIERMEKIISNLLADKNNKENESKSNNEILMKIWSATKKQDIQQLELILNNATYLSRELFEMLLFSSHGDVEYIRKIIYKSCDDVEKAKKRFNKYEELSQYNEEIYQTIEPEFLDGECGLSLNNEQLLRITNYRRSSKIYYKQYK